LILTSHFPVPTFGCPVQLILILVLQVLSREEGPI